MGICCMCYIPWKGSLSIVSRLNCTHYINLYTLFCFTVQKIRKYILNKDNWTIQLSIFIHLSLLAMTLTVVFLAVYRTPVT